jgi:predicted ATPase
MPLMLCEFHATGYRSLRKIRIPVGRLAGFVDEHGAVTPLTVIKRDGETWIEGLKSTGEFRDEDDA